ncbi:MAG TPA: competence/damage-inducible protein A [Candidatus Baltobacteraceae bacterium]|nr:competence/damage-inducible protein A [Candidatus Baltobacteraceae bacterium]
MGAELLTIGTELLLGQIIDTNASWMSQRLAEAGLDVFFKSTVGDNWGRIDAAIRLALTRADVLIMTGGLGPTEDDLTREVLAAVLDRPLRLDPDILAAIEARFMRRRIPMPENNRKQAMVPEGAEVLHNPRGTAPGLLCQADGRVLVCMPGVPSEMKPMLLEQVIPRIRDAFGIRGRIVSRVLKTCGISESMLDEKIGDYFRTMRNPSIGVLAHAGEIHIRMTCKGDDPTEIAAQLDALDAKLCERLGPLIFGRDEEKLEAAVGRLLRERRATLAVAESCTGGLVASRLTDISGSSEYFERGIVAYSAEAKQRLLGVPAETIADHGLVSVETARAMAVGVRRLAGTALGLATTGVAGPTGGTPEKPVGLVCVGLAWDGGDAAREFRLLGEREQVKYRGAQMALEMLRRHLLGIPIQEA